MARPDPTTQADFADLRADLSAARQAALEIVARCDALESRMGLSEDQVAPEAGQELATITDEMVERAAFAMERAANPFWTDEQFEIWWNRDVLFMERATSWGFF